MESLIGPSEIQRIAEDIANFWETSELSEEDKLKILNMTKDYYKDRNLTAVDAWLAQLCEVIINKNVGATGFEKS
jgi:hypothetical protein|tara:strand:- start:8610 stop:8834 length:225 start_codon:yes stop_codon:yes gene_type:complete